MVNITCKLLLQVKCLFHLTLLCLMTWFLEMLSSTSSSHIASSSSLDLSWTSCHSINSSEKESRRKYAAEWIFYWSILLWQILWYVNKQISFILLLPWFLDIPGYPVSTANRNCLDLHLVLGGIRINVQTDGFPQDGRLLPLWLHHDGHIYWQTHGYYVPNGTQVTMKRVLNTSKSYKYSDWRGEGHVWCWWLPGCQLPSSPFLRPSTTSWPTLTPLLDQNLHSVATTLILMRKWWKQQNYRIVHHTKLYF